MPTANEQIRDALLLHQVGLIRLADSINRRIIERLDETEPALRDLIERHLSRLSGRSLTDATNRQKLRALEAAIAELREEAFEEAYTRIRDESKAVARAESGFMAAALVAAVPVIFMPALPHRGSLGATVDVMLVEGRTLREWVTHLRREDTRRAIARVNMAVTQGQTPRAAARFVIGTAAMGGADGATNVTRTHFDALTRTAVLSAAAESRKQFAEENADDIPKEVYLATLDDRTTAFCRGMDGTILAADEGPFVPAHWRCRSIRVPLIEAAMLRGRDVKPEVLQQLLNEFARDNDITTPVGGRDELPFGTRGRFDNFRDRRLRTLIGRIPESLTYQAWLRSQSAAKQDEILGKAKGRLFRLGRLDLRRFVNHNRREFTLRELVIREEEAFRRAGLNPEDFL